MNQRERFFLFSKQALRNRRGASSVEFAFVFPIILLFFMAMTTFTQAILLRDTCQHAAYEGCRNALNIDSDERTVNDAAQELLSVLRVRDARVNIEPPVLTQTTRTVSVTVDIPFRNKSWVGSGFMPASWVATSTVELDRFQEDD